MSNRDAEDHESPCLQRLQKWLSGRVTGSITPFWVPQKVTFIVTRAKIMLKFHDEQNPNKRQT
jgi:hypothetical protein